MIDRYNEQIPNYALKEIACISCGNIGHISCVDDPLNHQESKAKKDVDWTISEAIEHGFYSFVSNYDSWQDYRKKREKNPQPTPQRLILPSAVPPSLSIIKEEPVNPNNDVENNRDSKKQEPPKQNDFMSLMLLNMD